MRVLAHWGLVFMSIVLPSLHVYAQEKADPTEGLKLKPTLLDAKGGAGTVLGLDFEYKKSWQRVAPFEATLKAGRPAAPRGMTAACGSYKEQFRVATDVIPTAVSFTDCAGEISARGTVTSDSAKNPNKLIDFSGSYAWMFVSSSRPSTKSFSAGGQLKYETDQSFENKQYVYGLRGTFTHLDGCTPVGQEASCSPSLNFLGLTLGLQRVDPTSDKAREAILGGSALEPYERVEFEAFYKYNLPSNWNYVSDLEFNYRRFHEVDAPAAITNAGIDRHWLGLVRLNFGFGGKGNLATTPKMFVQYSRGSLPFDTAKERVVKVGLTFELL